jgi:TRAP transporter TAXI family solute receptor
MKKYITFLLTTILLMTSLLACQAAPASPKTTTPPTQTPPTPPASTKPLMYISYPPGTTQYTVSSAQTPLLNKYTGLNFIMQPVPGKQTQFKLLENNEADIVFASAGGAWDARYSQPPEWGPDLQYPSMRIIMMGNSIRFSFLVRPNEGIKTIDDLRGKKVDRIRLDNVNLTYQSEGVLKGYGIDPEKDVTSLKSASTGEQEDNFTEKRVDAIYSSVSGAKMSSFQSTVGVLVLPIDPTKLGPIKKTYPYIAPDVVPKGEIGASVDTPVVSLPNAIISHKRLPDDAAYKIAKALCENSKELYSIHRDLTEWMLKNAVRDVGVPYHPGAIKYYKEAGVWPKEMDQKQQQLIDEEKTLPTKIK